MASTMVRVKLFLCTLSNECQKFRQFESMQSTYMVYMPWHIICL